MVQGMHIIIYIKFVSLIVFCMYFSNMYEEFKRMSEKEKVDRYIENPFFGSGIKFKDTVSIYYYEIVYYM